MKEHIFSPAKINLRLDIVGRDTASGYHYLEMILAPVTLGDKITIEESTHLSVSVENCREIIPQERNIVYRVIRAVESEIGYELPPLAVTICKEIPTGGGMGGGSSNGATVLSWLDSHFNLRLGMDRMTRIAASVGSDIPFFLFGTPAVVSGFGERVQPFRISSFPFHLLIVHPGFPIETAVAYALWDRKMLTKRDPTDTNLARVRRLSSLTEWIDFMRNDFEAVLFEEYPILREVVSRLCREGSDKVLMTGSGSAIVGFFGSLAQRNRAYERLRHDYGFVRKTEIIG